MIQKLEISGVHMEVGDDLHKYVIKKIGHLDRYIPAKARPSAHVEVKLKEGKTKDNNDRTLKVMSSFPHEVETTVKRTNKFSAAVDIAEEKLNHQLKKYKDLHAPPRPHRRLRAKPKPAKRKVKNTLAISVRKGY